MAVVVWERRLQAYGSSPRRRTACSSDGLSHYWEPYSAEVTQLIERSFQSNLTCVQLSDVATVTSAVKKVVHFGSLLEQSTADGSTHCGEGVPVRRSIYPADSCAGSGICWQWFNDHSNKWHVYIVSIQELLEAAYKNAEGEIDLSKIEPYRLPYIVDFANMMQKRKSTRTRRPVRRLENQPYPSVSAKIAGPSVSAFLRRSERCASRTVSLPTTEGGSTRPQSCVNTLPARPCGDHAQGSLASLLRSWFKSSLFRSASTPEFKSAANGSSSRVSGLVDEPTSAKKGGKTSLMKRHGKRPTAKNPCVVDSDAIVDQHAEFSTADLLRKYGTVQASPPDENCTICYESLRLPSSYEEADSVILELKRCGHTFHSACLRAMLGSQSLITHLQCPICKAIHGIKIGNQPPGKMSYFIIRQSLPSYDGVHTICINYDFSDGLQDESHPSPNRPYSARTFPRVCYLPDDEKGQKVLRLLIVAWQRRLTFTIGSSVTTGQRDVVTWNEIHHKTEFGSNYTGHGYPDPNYLDNVLLELAAQGVFDDNDEDVLVSASTAS